MLGLLGVRFATLEVIEFRMLRRETRGAEWIGPRACSE